MPTPLRLTLLVIALALSALAVQWLAPASLEKRAMAAYNAKDFKTALPLLQQWSQTPAVQNDPDLQAHVLEYTARAAYQAGDYPTALALFKKWENQTTDSKTLMTVRAFISLCDQQIKGIPTTDPGEPAVIATGDARVPHKPLSPGEVRSLHIKTLGNFDYDPNKGGLPPANVVALDGGHFRLKGFMLPLTSAAKVTDFALVPSLFNCCFGQPPGVQHVITCHLANGIDFDPDEVWVEGTLHVRPKEEEGYTSSLFELEATAVKPSEVITP